MPSNHSNSNINKKIKSLLNILAVHENLNKELPPQNWRPLFAWVTHVKHKRDKDQSSSKNNTNPHYSTFSPFHTLLTTENKNYSIFLDKLNITINHLKNDEPKDDASDNTLSKKFEKLKEKTQIACSKKQIAPVIEFLNNFFDTVSEEEISNQCLDQFGLKEGTSSTIADFCQKIGLTIPDVLNAPKLKDPQASRDVSSVSRTSNSSSGSTSNLSISNKTGQSSNSSFFSDESNSSKALAKLPTDVKNNDRAISAVQQLLTQPYHRTAIAMVANHLKEATNLPAFEGTELSMKARTLYTKIETRLREQKEREARAKAAEDALLLAQKEAETVKARERLINEPIYKQTSRIQKLEKNQAIQRENKKKGLDCFKSQVKAFMEDVIENSLQSGCKLRRLSFEKSRKKFILEEMHRIMEQEVTSTAELNKRLQAFIHASLMRRSSWRPWATHTTSAELCLQLLNTHYTGIRYVINELIGLSAARNGIPLLSYENLATFTGVEIAQDKPNNNYGNQNQPSVIPLSFFSRWHTKIFYHTVLVNQTKELRDNYVRDTFKF